MQELFNNYYKKLGMRRLQGLLNPKKFKLVDLPRDSYFHYLDKGNKDLDVNIPFLEGYKKKIYVDYADTILTDLGAPRRKNVIIKSLVRSFLSKNKEFKFLKDSHLTMKDSKTFLVANYNYLSNIYRYVDLPMTEYNEWRNTQNTVWNKINEVATDSARNNFVVIDVESDIPSFNMLNMYVDKTKTSMVKLFNTDSKKMILELWKWLSVEHRSLSVLDRLDVENYSKVNLLFTNTSNEVCLINLGYLNSWIKGQENSTGTESVSQFGSLQLSKFFLKFLMCMQASAGEDVDNSLIEETELDEEIEVPLTVIEDVDESIDLLSNLTSTKFKNRGVVVDETGNVQVDVNKDVDLETSDDIKKETLTASTYEETIRKDLEDNLASGLINMTVYKKQIADLESFNNLEDPFKSGLSIKEASNVSIEDIQIKPESTKITASDVVSDKSMLNSSLLAFDKDYLENVLNKDILSMVSSLQKSGMIIRDYKIDTDHSVLGTYETHTLSVKPVDGAASTIKFRLPKIDDDGSFMAGNSKYFLRKQRIDVPIRKINPNTVGLTSYYGKTFVTRSEKKADSALAKLVGKINSIGSDVEDTTISKIAPANVFDNNFKAPYIYSALSNYFKSLEVNGYMLILDHNERVKLLTSEELNKFEAEDKRLIGFNKKKEYLYVDYNNIFFNYNGKVFTEIGDVYKLFDLDISKIPVDISEVKIFSKTVPVGVVIAYYIGFSKLLKLLDVEYRVTEDKRPTIEDDQYSIRFADRTFIFTRKNDVASMVLSGFRSFSKLIRKHDSSEFDNKDIYFNLFSFKKLGPIYIRELDMMERLFIDSITESILVEMKEPTTFIGLLLRSSEMLLEYTHPDTQDLSSMRIRGYERLAGVVYKEISMAIRSYKNRNISGKSKIDMSTYQVWNTLMKDQSLKLIEDTNPMQNLKESEVVTYVGMGGRSKESMNKKSREFHTSDVGVISEATVDSSSVGINAYLVPDPNFKNLRGLVGDDKVLGSANIVSTSALLAPGSNHDDPKRVNFVSVQNSHVISTEGYKQPYLRTGYENVIASRTSDIFALIAKQDGVVVSKDLDGIIVKYEDGSEKGLNLGTVYGKAEGSIYPHEIVSNLSVGDKFVAGNAIGYNSNFFEEDFLDPKSIILKTSMVAKTALYESNQTFEDSSSISKRVSRQLRTSTIKMRSVVVDFNQKLADVIKSGRTVKPKDVLLVIEDEITSTSNAFDDESLGKLRKLSSQAPTAKYDGVVDRIEVFYNGDKKDMSDSLKKMTKQSDALLANISKSSGKSVVTGLVNSDYRVSGTPLTGNKAEIRIYLKVENEAGVGDKGIFANQLKSIFAEVMTNDMRTESGELVDAVFGYRSIAARIVNSPVIMGTTITLLKVIGKQVIKEYRS